MTGRWCVGDRYEFHMVAGSGTPKTWVCSCTARGWGWPKPHWQATVATPSFFARITSSPPEESVNDAV